MSITEDPTILSGSLRSTLDVFEEYEDAEIVSRSTYSMLILANREPCSLRPFDVCT
jgi:hypothetical protein